MRLWTGINSLLQGQAKLDIVRHAGDSLAGRSFTFHLLPLTLGEVCSGSPLPTEIPEFSRDFVDIVIDTAPAPQEAVIQLMTFSGFPEPFLQQARAFHNKWARDYIETVIREDIGALTGIVDRQYIFDLYNLLPGMVGSPLSQSSLASHLQISPVTVKNYLRRLEDFSLFYIRNKQKQETDFLIVRDSVPWLLVEAKLADGAVDRHHFEIIRALDGVPLIQVCLEPNVVSMEKRNVYRISANRLFASGKVEPK